jgi:hypothetical protein
LELFELFLLLLQDQVGFFLELPLLFFIDFLLEGLFLEVELVLGEIPVNQLLIDFLSRLTLRNQDQEDIICAETYPIKMEDFLFVRDNVSIQVTPRIFAPFNGN